MIRYARPILLCCLFFLHSGLKCQDLPNDKNTEHLEALDTKDNLALTLEDEAEDNEEEIEEEIEIIDDSGPRIINKIIITRNSSNNYLPDDAILSVIPYREGEIFRPHKSNSLIRNLYKIGEPFSYFDQIEILGEDLDDGKINLHIITNEKPEISKIIFEGNKHLQEKDINKKIDITDVHAINEEDLQSLAQIITRLYQEKNYHHPKISWEMETQESETKPSVIIKIDEGCKSMVKRVCFRGNNNISHKQLKNIIFTREDWIGGFLTKAGSFQQDFLERDKFILENYYKSNGYMNARVTGVDVKLDDCNHFTVTFDIYEGDLYCIGDVEISGDDEIDHNYAKAVIPMKSGDLYSVENLRKSMELLKDLWGDKGYLFVDVDPSLVPDEDRRVVNVSYNIDQGKKVYINRINIKGNRKTRDKVIRRNLVVKEGDCVRHSQMEISKNRVENLSYFEERGGVNWKINRLDDENADLDLVVNEVKTGRAAFNLGYGGSPLDLGSPSTSFSIGGSVMESNLFGRGIRLNSSINWSKQQTTFSINLVDPWFLDRPMYAETDFHIARSDYNEELQNVSDFKENRIGGYFGLGMVTGYKKWFRDVMTRFRTSFDNITYNRAPAVGDITTPEQAVKQLFLNNSFQPGGLAILEFTFAKDFRNHTAHPTTGYQFAVNSRCGLGFKTSASECSYDQKYLYNGETKIVRVGACPERFGYFRTEIDATYYTPLLPDNLVVLMLHGFAGFVKRFDGRSVPYAELFHIGGPTSVRGYLYGQISPSYLGDSLGAGRAFFVNTELIFPITPDFSVKGCIFYDGGSGWHAPYVNIINCYDKINDTNTYRFLENNCFDFRQSIGIGVRMLRPQPIRIDYGFKLDRRKGEPISELHFSSYREF